MRHPVSSSSGFERSRHAIANQTLCRRTLLPIEIPAVFVEDLARAGHGVESPALASHRPHSLAEEFCDAVGYRFDWGWVIAGHLAWYCPEDHLPGCVWRLVPTRFWERAVSLVITCTIPETLARFRRAALDALRAGVPHWIERESGLAYDPCVPQVSGAEDAARLRARLERPFLPRVLPPVLRWLHARLGSTGAFALPQTGRPLARSSGVTRNSRRDPC
jgi:hypothetical protein